MKRKKRLQHLQQNCSIVETARVSMEAGGKGSVSRKNKIE